MKSSRWMVLCLIAGFLAFAEPYGCITVNVYFPEKQLQEAAEEIVDEVRPESREDALVPAADVGEKLEEARLRPGGPLRFAGRSEGGFPWLALVGHPAALAEEEGPAKGTDEKIKIKLKVNTPRIQAIKKSLKKRYAKLLPFYKRGALGEANTGYLVARDTKSLNRKETRDVKLLLRAEKQDRQELYTEIAKQNSIDKSLIPRIGKLFSAEWQKKCKTGWWIQDKKGKWAKKKPPKKKEKENGKKGADQKA